MAIRRVERKTKRTPEQLTELRSVRERFQRERPSQQALEESGDWDGPVRQGDLLELFTALAEVKRQREAQGLTLAEIAQRSGLDVGMISRLERGKIGNPTFVTLWRYAEAVGARLSLTVEPTPAAPPA